MRRAVLPLFIIAGQTMNLIETQDLAIGYGNKVLVQNIHFCLKEKQICCLLGANGAGKSTFLKTLLGLQPALQGEVCWQQQNKIRPHQ